MRDLASKLMLEITEREVPDALGIAAALGEAYRAGSLIALDDLNLNEANLVVLSRIQTNVVKFDKSFAGQMLESDGCHERVDTLAALIQTAHFRVIIEGIETAAQIEILKKAGVEWVQGFYFSEPLPAAEFLEYFSAHQ
jgi:EAL domain-containing protein (putative c-di-GMP-specific phosphodiesterase class I)